jgi:hypothetical protein
MSKQNRHHPIQALGLALFVTLALFAGTVTLSGSTAAAVSSDTFSVTDATDVVQPDGTITVEVTDTTGDVTFLIQDPIDSDVATVTKNFDGTDSNTINLGNLNFGDGLDAGTATIMADQGTAFVEAEATATFEVDNEFPTASIDSQFDGAENTSYPTITGNASDNVEVQSVEVAISDSSGQYYDRSSFSSDSVVWLSTSSPAGPSDWSYDTAGVTPDGEYDVAVRVEDAAGHARSYVSGTEGPPAPVDSSYSVSYTVDTSAPSVTGPSISASTVEVGDSVTVSATVTDATAGVESVEANASQLGGSESLALTETETDNDYQGTFTVSNPSASDGETVALDINATDAFGQSNTDTSVSTTLDTDVASVEQLSVRQDFVGIVQDANNSVRVTAQGVEDAQGNAISSGTATLDIGGTTYGGLTVTDGAIDTEIDPTAIPNDAETGEVTVSIVEAGDGPYTDQVMLVHEANGLDEGYQVEGTPMDASNVVFENVSDVITYDPTEPEMPWVAPSENQAGEGYYVYGSASDARIGYTFAETGELRSEYLHEGYNLVAATPDLNDGDTVQLNSDLGDSLTVDDIGVYTRDPTVSLNDPSGTTDATAFEEVTAGTTTVGDYDGEDGYEGYFIYVDSGEVVRIVEATNYDPTEGS